jgi:predicted nucleic acid-binding protein
MPLHARHYVIVVADTTPLLYLSRIGRLNIVQALYACLLVPREVHKEIVERRPATPGVERGRFSCVARAARVGIDEGGRAVLRRTDCAQAKW